MRHARKAREGVPRSMNTVMHRERWCAMPARRATEVYSLITSQGAERGGRGCGGDRMRAYSWDGVPKVYSLSTSQGAERGGRGCGGDRMRAYSWDGVLELTLEDSRIHLAMVGMARALYELAWGAEQSTCEWQRTEDGDLHMDVRF